MLNFVGKADGEAGWTAVEKRFIEITATINGLLPRSKFGECIGMDSEDFALGLFDALARRRDVTEGVINLEHLREFYEQICDQSIDSRLKTFFDLMDKDNDGRITEDEVREFIKLSSSANNLSIIWNRADEYAALIMEELDRKNNGYITIEGLDCLFMLAEVEYLYTYSEESKVLSRLLSLKLKTTPDLNPLKRWYMKTTWMDLAKPIALYAQERLIRTFRSSSSTITILNSAVYQGNVLNLLMSKPRHFIYESGQYMLVNCPTVSSSEWHPFYITSAPQDEYLSIHVKSVGDWTEALVEVFIEACKPHMQVGDTLYGAINHKLPKIMIDGPYGTPAQEYKKYEVILLVGLGIGASPMISIIKDISKYYTEAKENFKKRKAYFYWLTKEQGSYGWFQDIMNEVIDRDIYKVINLYNYCTSVYEEGDVRSTFIRMLQSLYHAKTGVDIVSGTRVMTHFAKPNWKNVYKQIAVDHRSSHVGVFYCGEVALAKELRDLAMEFTHKTTTKFSFHKENFYPQC